MVAIGTLVSATWILSVNSWMHTPAGWAMNAQGQFVPADWWAIVFNASFPSRLVHTVIAAYLTTALVVGGVSAWHILKRHDTPQVRIAFSMAMWMATLVAPLQLVAGDTQWLNTLEHQPIKVLAMEGDFEPSPNGAPLVLFGIPSNADGRVNYKVEIPKLGSLILKHDPNAPLKGLKDYPRDQWPPVVIVFWSFRIMVGLGLAMIALGAFSLIQRLRRKLYDRGLLHRFALVMGPAGFVAVIAGWVTTEVGRQPWVIYGLLRTADAVSPIATPGVTGSLIAFVLVYFSVFAAGTFYILRLMAKPPHDNESDPAATPIRSAGITPAPAKLGGIHVEGRSYAGGWWDWLTPFSLLCGVALMIGYALLGSCWLIWRTEGPLHDDARKFAKWLTPAMLAVIGAVSLATPFLEGKYYERWLAWPGVLFSAQMPLTVAIIGFLLWRAIAKGKDHAPFLWTLTLFGLCMAGLAISIWPDVIPGRVSIWQAASPAKSQTFMLVGVSILLPLILAYTGWAYWVFRGKVGDDGYHAHDH
ncbi:MAG: cytochrome ubiquinol oxidase subunit I [Sphingomonas sp.]